MDRLACVDLRALPLQLLLQRHPDWAAHPTAVVDEDRPTGTILWVNERARRRRILAGQRYAQGLSRAADLRAGVVPRQEIDTTVRRLSGVLRELSPGVEPSSTEPGLFWLDASGLQRLHPSLEAWARSIVERLRALGFRATVVVGFSRFGSYALARTKLHLRRGVLVCASPAEEADRARDVPLDRLALPPALREGLTRLGVTRVGDLLRLPANGLLERFGPEAHRLHALAANACFAPLQPEPEPEPLRERVDLDHPELETTRLLFLIKHRLDRLLTALARRGEALAALELALELDGVADPRREILRPAAPTLDGAQLLDLVRLRLDRLQLDAGVVGLALDATSVRASREQLQLFAEKPRRDLAAADRALARLRADLGEQAVLHVVLRQRHLPEASFTLEPLARCVRPAPAPGQRVLVRRLLQPSEPLACRRGPGKTWAVLGAQPAAGPYILSGGWWRGARATEVHREYYFARTRPGELLWLYYDRPRNRWLLQGRVE